MVWIDAAGGYQVRLDDRGKLVCRNAKGKQLSSVPGSLKADPAVVRLRQLTDWLRRHESECRAEVDRWMVRSLPVPRTVLTEVWPDPAWRTSLRDLVIAPVLADGSLDHDGSGFLRDVDVDVDRGLGVVTLGGETNWLTPELVAIPHPVLLTDLDELREFAAQSGVEQGVQQLFRQTWKRPAVLSSGSTSVLDFDKGEFDQLRHARSRARGLGYQVRGGYAVCPVFEGDVLVEARYWLGADLPDAEAHTGELEWGRPGENTLPLAEVGPVAWSEGMRMAAAVYAGRLVDSAEDGAA